MYSTSTTSTGYFTDLGRIIGRDAPGLQLLGAMYNFGKTTEIKADLFPEIMQNGVNAKLLLIASHNDGSAHYSETFFVLKPRFWLCGIYLNHTERVVTVVSASDNTALALHGIDIMAWKLGLSQRLEVREGGIGGLEHLLAERAIELILKVPKKRVIGIIGDSE